MRKYLFVAVLMALVAVSCNRDRDLTQATVVDTGDIAAGGCGYLLEINGENRTVRPSNLPSAYRHNGYKVKVKFDSDGSGEVCSVFPNNRFVEVVQLTVIKTDLD